MKFEEALKAMREGKKVSLYGRIYRIDETDLVSQGRDDDYWDIVSISGWDILAEDWEIVE